MAKLTVELVYDAEFFTEAASGRYCKFQIIGAGGQLLYEDWLSQGLGAISPRQAIVRALDRLGPPGEMGFLEQRGIDDGKNDSARRE